MYLDPVARPGYQSTADRSPTAAVRTQAAPHARQAPASAFGL